MKEQLFIVFALEQLIPTLSNQSNERSIAQFTLHTLQNNQSFVDELNPNDPEFPIIKKAYDYVTSKSFIDRLMKSDLNLAMSILHTAPLLSEKMNHPLSLNEIKI